MVAVIVEWHEAVTEVKFRAVAGLAALKLLRVVLRSPLNRVFPQAKIKEPVVAETVIETDEFVDHTRTNAEAEHKGDESASLRMS